MNRSVSVGDKIYIPGRAFISHGEDDVAGGSATVSKVTRRESGGGIHLFIEVKEVPGTSYNWTFLRDRQVELAAQFGASEAHPDPDVNTPWIQDGDIVDGQVYHGPDVW